MKHRIMEVSRELFREVVLPALAREHPEEMAQAAFGLFGYGSDAHGFDDELFRDHHWGLRIDGLLPEPLFRTCSEAMQRVARDALPAEFHGTLLRIR